MSALASNYPLDPYMDGMGYSYLLPPKNMGVRNCEEPLFLGRESLLAEIPKKHFAKKDTFVLRSKGTDFNGM